MFCYSAILKLLQFTSQERSFEPNVLTAVLLSFSVVRNTVWVWGLHVSAVTGGDGMV